MLESDHEELRHAVRTHAKVQVGSTEIGQVVTIFGAKGGVGATAIAVRLTKPFMVLLLFSSLAAG